MLNHAIVASMLQSKPSGSKGSSDEKKLRNLNADSRLRIMVVPYINTYNTSATCVSSGVTVFSLPSVHADAKQPTPN